MTRYLILIGILITVATSVTFADSLEWETNPDKGFESAKLCLAKPLTSHTGLFLFGQQCKNWSQIYAGPSFNTPHLSASIGIGKETNGTRYGGSLWTGKSKITFLYLYSGGASGSWHESELRYQATNKIGLSLVENSAKGYGGRIDYKMASNFKLRGTYYHNENEDITILSGVLCSK